MIMPVSVNTALWGHPQQDRQEGKEKGGAGNRFMQPPNKKIGYSGPPT